MNRILSPLPSEADRVAVEHVVWAASAGHPPREILNMVGMSWTGRREPDWHDCVMAVAIAWRRLPPAVTSLRRTAA